MEVLISLACELPHCVFICLVKDSEIRTLVLKRFRICTDQKIALQNNNESFYYE